MQIRKKEQGKRLAAGFVVLGLFGALAALAPSAAAACNGPVDVQITGDACAQVLAVSGTGNAYGSDCKDFVVTCVSVSGTGNAQNVDHNDETCGRAQNSLFGCAAVSGTGRAGNEAGEYGCGTSGIVIAVPYSPTIQYVPYPSAGCLAVSGTGDASNSAEFGCGLDGTGFGCIAVSGEGKATNTATDPYNYHTGCARGGYDQVLVGCVAVSGTGDAENHAGRLSCGSGYPSMPEGVLVGCVAISGTGNAHNEADGATGGWESCGNNQGPALALGCVAVSGTGSASNSGDSAYLWGSERPGPCETEDSYYSGVGAGCLAVSGTGSASNTVDGTTCDPSDGGYGGSLRFTCIAASGSDLNAPLAAALTPTSPGAWQGPHGLSALQGESLPAMPVPATLSWWDALVAWFAAFFGGAV